MKLISTLAFVLFSVIIQAQPYAIGHMSMTFNDPVRNRDISAEIYYPADTTGDNVPIEITDLNVFPVLGFGHGFVITWTAYENVWTNLVPQGYIMVFPTTETGILPSHANFGKDLAFAISSVTSLGATGNVFAGRVSDKSAVMGHSMGGGAAFLAAAGDASIDVLVTLAPAETNPSAISAAATLSIPALIMAGGNDCVTPPATNQIPMYDAMLSDCKTLITITGGSHCQMAENNFLCGIGEATCSPPPAISREQQHAVIDRYIGNWLSAKLKQDCVSGQNFDQTISADPEISYSKNCTLCDILSVATNDSDAALLVYPNPFSDYVLFEVADGAPNLLSISDASGRIVLTQNFNQNIQIDARQFAAGIYVYRIVRTDGSITTGKIVKRN